MQVIRFHRLDAVDSGVHVYCIAPHMQLGNSSDYRIILDDEDKATAWKFPEIAMIFTAFWEGNGAFTVIVKRTSGPSIPFLRLMCLADPGCICIRLDADVLSFYLP